MTEYIEQSEKQNRFIYWMVGGIVLSVGIFFRLYLIADQIPLDDEWHGIYYAADHSLWYILTHYIRAGATCIPLNLYSRFLLETYGLSEILLVLPSLAAGILSLIVFPFLPKPILNKRILIIFSGLIAISPLLVFYSRCGRPYSIYCFLGFSSFISLYQWSRSKKNTYAVIYIFTGALSIYFHLFAVISSLAPLICLFVLKGLNLSGRISLRKNGISPNFCDLIKISGGIIFITSLFMFYPILQTIGPFASGNTDYTLYSFTGLASFFSGTSDFFLTGIFFVLFFIGLFCLFQIDTVFSAMICSVFLGYFLSILIMKPFETYIPIVIARYILPLFPISYLLVALGMDCLFKKITTQCSVTSKIKDGFFFLMTVLFLAISYCRGPLINIYQPANNFTKNSAFQESYKSFEWNYARLSDGYFPINITYENMSSFYKQISKMPDVKKIIEYPMPLGSHLNPLYFYQYHHKKKVAVGFVRFNYNEVLPQYVINMETKIYGNYYIDFVLSKVRNPDKLKFRNIIDMSNIQDVIESSADFIVLHKHIIAELRLDLSDNKLEDTEPWETYPLVKKLKPYYIKTFGEPVFEDENIIVFKIR